MGGDVAQPGARTNDSTKHLIPPVSAFAASAVILVIATWLRNRPAVSRDAPLDHLVQLLPGLLLVIVLVAALVAGSRLRLALTAFAVAVAVRFAGPALVDSIPSAGIPNVVWTSKSEDGYVWVNAIFDGTNEVVRNGGIAMLVATALIVLSIIWVALGLFSVLVAPALRSSFGIDTTLLIGALAIAGMLSWISAYGVVLDPADPLSALESGDIWVLTRTLVWVLPVVLWLAFTSRRGGALALGAAAGAFTALAILPWTMDRLAELLDGPRSVYAFAGSSEEFEILSGYRAFDPLGTTASLVVLSGALLLVTFWWATSHHASVERIRVTAPAGSPVSGLAVLSFVLAWIPLTCLPAIVLGHMAYDQVSTSDVPQRGIGLARWSIVLAYFTLAGTAYFALTTWAR